MKGRKPTKDRERASPAQPLDALQGSIAQVDVEKLIRQDCKAELAKDGGRRRTGNSEIGTAKEASLVTKIRFREIDRLVEEKPGIYEIRTDSGIALKVGIAVNLRNRLLQHRASRQSCLKLKAGGKWDNPSDVRSKGSILAKHLYYDGSITTDYDLSAQTGRQAFLDERCYIIFEVTETKAEVRKLEKDRESYGRYRYVKTVQKR